MIRCHVLSCNKEPIHIPCCSSHGKPLCCQHYRRFHFVEVRPCCREDED